MEDQITEYKFLTDILRQLEDVKKTESSEPGIDVVITAIKDRKDYLFSKYNV